MLSVTTMLVVVCLQVGPTCGFGGDSWTGANRVDLGDILSSFFYSGTLRAFSN